MSLDEHKALLRRFFDVYASGDLRVIDQIVDPAYVGHVAAGDRDRDGLRDRISAFRAVMPDVVVTVEAQVAEGDLVATRVSAYARHSETGLPTRLLGLNLSRVRAGKIVEAWNSWETFEDDVLGDDADRDDAERSDAERSDADE